MGVRPHKKLVTMVLYLAMESSSHRISIFILYSICLFLFQVFDQLDTDKSGDLSRDEIKHALEVLGLQDQFNLDKLLEAMDTDANGSISIEEFKNGLPKEVLQTMSSKLNEKGLIEGI